MFESTVALHELRPLPSDLRLASRSLQLDADVFKPFTAQVLMVGGRILCSVLS